MVTNVPEPEVGAIERALAVGDSIVFVYDPRAATFDVRGNGIEILAIGTDLGADVADRRIPLAAFVERAHPDGARALTEAVARAAEQGVAFETEIAFGEGRATTWLQVRGRRDDDTRADRPLVVGTMRDVTAFKRLEVEHGELVRTTQAILQTSSDVISIIDHDGVIREIGSAAARVLGTDADTLVGGTVFTTPVVHPDDRDRVSDVYRRLLSGEIEHEESRYRVQTGGEELRVVEGHRRVLRGPEGDVDGVVVVVSDVTEQVRLENELRAARTLAEEASHAKDEFLSRMSHELRTPLNAVIGFGRLLERSELDADQGESVGQILKAGEQLLTLTNDMLDISRATSGRITVTLEPIELDPAVRETVAEAKPLAAEHGITVTVDTGAPARVLADRARLRQVLRHLLANAVQYNRPGGTVSISTVLVENARARIDVRDTGRGIAADDLPRLFEPFDRLGAQDTNVSGNGLGLVLAKALLEAMSGALLVESTAGEGSVFGVELALVAAPSATATAATDAARAASTPEPTAVTPSGGAPGGYTVLYIEDNPSNLRLVERILASREEYTLLSATHGQVGLRLARQHRPTLVLLDLHLPDIMGDEVLARLKEAPETRDIPVLMLSADATNAQVQRLLEEGATDYMTKPLDIERFVEAVDRLCAQRAATAG